MGEIVLLLAAAIAIVALFKKLRLSPVLGYLVVGSIIGPHGFRLVNESEQIKHIAELGVVFLLFSVGLELSLERLIAMRRQVFGFGGLQVLLCGAVFSTITYFISHDIKIAFVVGFVFALSSTPVILEVLKERGEENTQHGRLSIATLILQDLAFVPLLIIIPMLADENSNILQALSFALIQAFVVLAIIVFVGKKLFGPLFRVVASLKSQELFIALMFFILLGAALFTEKYGLSLAFGAFVAGLLIAETEFRTQVETDIEPFKGLFLGLFFITVGMKIDANILVVKAPIIFGLLFSIALVKTVIIFGLARIFGFMKSCSIKTGFMLAQASEFGFVLFGLANEIGFIEGELNQIFVITISMSMAITPMLAIIGNKVAKMVEYKNPIHYESTEIASEVSDLKRHIIIVGFGKIGKTTAELLKYKDIPFVAIDDDTRNVHQGRNEGFPVYYGKCSIVENLEKIGLVRASAVAITLDDQEEVINLATQLQKKHPEIKVIARARDRAVSKKLRELGVDISIAEKFESSLMISNFILHSIGLGDNEIEDAINQFREEKHPESQIVGCAGKIKEDFVIV